MVASMTMRLAVIAATLGIASLLVTVACSSSTTGSAPGVDAGGETSADAAPALPFPLDQACGPSTETDPCGKCAREHCCSTRSRIVTDASDGIVRCMQAPGCDTACATACFEKDPTETKPFLEHLSCLSHFCPVECGDAPAGGCLVCIEANCARESLACNLSSDCFLYDSCFNACDKAEACINDCAARHPKGAELANVSLVCASNRCARECGN